MIDSPLLCLTFPVRTPLTIKLFPNMWREIIGQPMWGLQNDKCKNRNWKMFEKNKVGKLDSFTYELVDLRLRCSRTHNTIRWSCILVRPPEFFTQ
ncbi:hypothetical protein Hanom_Chr05g00431321 [Helianthus anomalus]